MCSVRYLGPAAALVMARVPSPSTEVQRLNGAPPARGRRPLRRPEERGVHRPLATRVSRGWSLASQPSQSLAEASPALGEGVENQVMETTARQPMTEPRAVVRGTVVSHGAVRWWDSIARRCPILGVYPESWV